MEDSGDHRHGVNRQPRGGSRKDEPFRSNAHVHHVRAIDTVCGNRFAHDRTANGLQVSQN